MPKPSRIFITGDRHKAITTIYPIAKHLVYSCNETFNTDEIYDIPRKRIDFQDGSWASVDVTGSVDIIRIHAKEEIKGGKKKYIIPLLWPAYEVYDNEYEERGVYWYGNIIADWNTLEPLKYVVEYNKKNDGTWDYDNPNFTIMPYVTIESDKKYVTSPINYETGITSPFQFHCEDAYTSGPVGWGRQTRQRSISLDGETVYESTGTYFDGTVIYDHTCLKGFCPTSDGYFLGVTVKNETYDNTDWEKFGEDLERFYSKNSFYFNFHYYSDYYFTDSTDSYSVVLGMNDVFAVGAYYKNQYKGYRAVFNIDESLILESSYQAPASRTTTHYQAACSSDITDTDTEWQGTASGDFWYCNESEIFYRKDIPEEQMEHNKDNEVLLSSFIYSEIIDLGRKPLSPYIWGWDFDYSYLLLTYVMKHSDIIVRKDFPLASTSNEHYFKETREGTIDGTPEETGSRWYDYEWMELIRLDKKYAKKLFGMSGIPDSEILYIDIGIPGIVEE